MLEEVDRKVRLHYNIISEEEARKLEEEAEKRRAESNPLPTEEA